MDKINKKPNLGALSIECEILVLFKVFPMSSYASNMFSKYWSNIDRQ